MIENPNIQDRDTSLDILSAKQSARLCQQCGVCCTGAFFSHVNLTDTDVARLKGTPVKTYTDSKDKPVFDQPCPVLSGTSCSIYDKRPGSCRSYLCKLTRNVLNGQVAYETAVDSVSELKALAIWLHANVPVPAQKVGKNTSVQKRLSPTAILGAWQGKPDGVKTVPSPKALSVMLTNLLLYFTKQQNEAALSEQEKNYIAKAFAFAKLCDREFEKTSLLREYSQLVQRF